MRRAPSQLVKPFLLFGLIAAGAVAAASNSAASDAVGKKVSNSFNLYVTPAAGTGTVVVPAPGVGLASSKAVITDPYKVPLIQNAGSLHPGR